MVTEISQRKTNTRSHIQNLKNNTNEPNIKQETDSEIETKVMATKG